ncbi:MAG: DUF4831 family protein [Prevotella sp.]|nr:DUF4831 family protein [Prevotella sp.]
MKIMFRHFFLLAFLLLSSINFFAQQIPPTTPGRTPKGVVYYLPKTAIRFNLLVEKTTYKPGDFAKYADKYLHQTTIIQKEEVSYAIVNYGLSEIGIKDESKCFEVSLKGKSANATISLTDDGVLQSVNAEPIPQEAKEPFKPAPIIAPANPRQYLNAEVLAAESIEKMAELTVNQISELKVQYQKLLTGEAEDMPTDKDELNRMLQQNQKEQDILMSLFTGTTVRDTTEHYVVVCPEKEIEREIIFRIDKDKGLVDKDNPTGSPYYMKIEDLHRTPLEKYDIPKNKIDGGFYTNVPGKIKFSFYHEDDFIFSSDLYAAQFGFVQIRSGSLFKQYVTHMALNPYTGYVEKISFDNN